MSPPLPPAPAELLSHAGWMRALAGSLVGDAASADDVVQESMVAALRRPPRTDRPIEAWLARVVRNVASNFRRDERRKLERLARSDAREAPSDPADTIERLDTQRMLVELVRELDEPARRTIVLRYFEGLTSAEIGHRMGVSDATVRWRLQKALGELREKLKRDFGSREAWSAVLAPLAVSSKVTASVTAGAIAMGSASKVVLAAVVVTVIGAGWWFTRDSRMSRPPTTEAATASVEPDIESSLPVAEPAREREALVVEQESTSATPQTPAPSTPPASSTARIRARFVDATGQPWAQVLFRDMEWFKLSTTSGADGRVELGFDDKNRAADLTYEFVASSEGCATRILHATLPLGQLVDLGDLILEREGRVRGMVHDERGAGLAGVTVGLAPVGLGSRDEGSLRRQGPGNRGDLSTALSDPRGLFDLRGVPAGEWRLWGKVDGRGYGSSEPIEVHVDEQKSDVDFLVPAYLATDLVSGKVLDPRGDPVPKAFVTFRYESRLGSGFTSALTGENGAFEIIVQVELPGRLTGSDDRKKRWSDVSISDVRPGAHDIVLQFAESSALTTARLRVRGPADEVVREVSLQSAVRFGNSITNSVLEAHELEPGLYEFQLPATKFGLSVKSFGYFDRVLEDLDPMIVPQETKVSLERAPMLRGRVVASGAAVAGALIGVQFAIAKDKSYTLNDFPCLMKQDSGDEVTCTTDGSFSVALESKAPVYLRCTAPGFAATIVGPIAIDSAPESIEVQLDVGGAIEGRVLSKDGTAVVGAIVGITNGDAHPRTMRSSTDGSFHFEGLTVGQWLVLERDEEFTTATTATRGNNKEQHIDWSCEVVVGRTTHYDLKLDR